MLEREEEEREGEVGGFVEDVREFLTRLGEEFSVLLLARLPRYAQKSLLNLCVGHDVVVLGKAVYKLFATPASRLSLLAQNRDCASAS